HMRVRHRSQRRQGRARHIRSIHRTRREAMPMEELERLAGVDDETPDRLLLEGPAPERFPRALRSLAPGPGRGRSQDETFSLTNASAKDEVRPAPHLFLELECDR